MIRADLHLHSTCSDGSATPEQLVLMAKNAGLTHIALTDHDMLSHNAEAAALGRQAGIAVLPGVELSTADTKTGKKAHILGYCMQGTQELRALCADTRARRQANSLRQLERLRESGVDIPAGALRLDCIYKQHIMAFLVLHGYAGELFGEFYRRVFKNGGICDLDISYPDVRDAVRAVKNAGGYAVLAHPGQQKNFALIKELVPFGLAGVEYRHPDNGRQDCVAVRQLCDEYRLFLTGGSDYHGIYQQGAARVGDFLSPDERAPLFL